MHVPVDDSFARSCLRTLPTVHAVHNQWKEQSGPDAHQVRTALIAALVAMAVFCFATAPVLGQSYSPLWAPSSNNQLQAGCVNQNNQLVAGCTLYFYTGYYSGTNAHTHYSPTAPFSGITSSCVTDASGHCTVTVTTTIVGHAEFAEACAYFCGYYYYAVGVPIYYVSTHGVWTFVGATAAHGNSTDDNHWMTSNAAYGIYNATVLY